MGCSSCSEIQEYDFGHEKNNYTIISGNYSGLGSNSIYLSSGFDFNMNYSSKDKGYDC